jgi:hypothetical protein
MTGGHEDRTTPAPERPDADPRALVVVGALVVVLAVIAAGTGALRGFENGVAAGGDLALRALLGAVVGAAVGGLLVLGIRRLGAARTGALGLASGAALVLVVVIVASVGATAGVSTAPLGPEVPTHDSVEEGPATTVVLPRDTLPDDFGKPADLPNWVGTVLAIIGLILVLLLVLGMARTFQMPRLRLRGGLHWGNRRHAEITQEDLDLDAAADSFADSAGSMGDDDDPRAAIIAAYVRLLAGLESAGCARLPYEAPEEHLRRSLHALGVRPEHMRVVVDRFLVARFSTHPMTVADRDEVRTALREAGEQLRQVAAARQAADEAARA